MIAVATAFAVIFAKEVFGGTGMNIFNVALVTRAFLFFASNFMVYFLGDDYQDTDVLFKIMAFVPIFVGVGGVVGQLKLLAMGNKADKQYFSKTYGVAACVALLSVLVLSYSYGMYGTACSLLLTEIVVCVMMMWRAYS